MQQFRWTSKTIHWKRPILTDHILYKFIYIISGNYEDEGESGSCDYKGKHKEDPCGDGIVLDCVGY